uniref:Amino acid transporter transmembrane domain-containing protein n=1 Tax=Arcella intermedia TaxID=1963864 RepID=A0A6B2L6L4_9EUKA
MTNTILGAGMLGLPYAVQSSGTIASAFFFVFSCTITMFGLHLLSLSAAKSKIKKESSYFTLAKETYPRAAILIELAVALKCFGVSLSYLLVFSSLMTEVAHFLTTNEIVGNRNFWLGISVILCVPWCLLKTLNALRFTSYVALVSVAYIFILVVYNFLRQENIPTPSSSTFGPLNITKFFSNLPIFVFAFTCHQNLLPIQNELNGNTHKTKIVIITSVLIALCIYVLIGYCGYFTYGRHIKSNIISNLPQDVPTTICRIAVSLLVAFSYPLQIHPCRNSLMSLLLAFPRIHRHPATTYIVTLCICGITYLLGFLLTDLGIVFSIVGATGSVTLCYLLPGLFYLGMTRGDGWPIKRILAASLLAGGLIFMINSLVWIFSTAVA